jgi:ribosomal protein S18 acetylase RimI-like enzyme
MEVVAIRRAGAERLHVLEPLYRALHAHHLQVAQVPLVADPDVSWQRRRRWYREKLAEGALLLVAEREAEAVGYALVEFLTGPDDTWPVGDRYAELVSLVVAPGARRQGIGGRLMAAVEQELDAAGVRDLTVSVLTGNDDALRFYARHGLRAGEVVLWRFDHGRAGKPAT